MTEKKSDGINWSSPVLVYGALGVLVLIFGKRFLSGLKDFLRGFTTQPSTTPTGEPVIESPDHGRITASFLEPTNGAHIWPTLVPFLGVRVKIAVNNPWPVGKAIELKTVVTFYPRIVGEKSAQQSALQITVPAGRSTHDVIVARPGTITGSVDAVAEVYINGASAAIPISFVVE